VQVNNHVNKLENISVQSVQSLEPSIVARATAAAGLVLLRNKQYKLAARKFLQVSTELGDSFTAVCVAEDIATYGALCALADFDRDELRQRVVEGGSSFRNFLELSPKIRGVVNDIFESKYGSALSVLEAMKGELQLDLHLKDHAVDLIKMIRSRCIVQYFSPYMSVSLDSMSTAFACSLAEMESSVAKLIMDGKIAARIDSQAKTLHVRQTEKRAESYRKIAKLSESYIGDMRAMLLRMSCLEHDFVVRGRPSMASGFGANQGSDMHYGANQQDSGDLPAAMLGGDDTAMHQGD
jgi:COP9 signalosome complex subunit 1